VPWSQGILKLAKMFF